MNGSLQILAIVATLAAAYTAIVFESMVSGPTLLPQLPLLLAVWAVCRRPSPTAIAVSAALGLGCDLLAAGPLGPMLMSATLVALVMKGIQTRFTPTSPAPLVILTALFVTATLTLSTCVAGLLLHSPVDVRSTLLMAASRGVTSAFVAAVAVLSVRSLQILQRVATSL